MKKISKRIQIMKMSDFYVKEIKKMRAEYFEEQKKKRQEKKDKKKSSIKKEI